MLFKNLLMSSILLSAPVWLSSVTRLHNRCEKIENELIELRTIVQKRIRIDRGDYGWDDPSMAPDIEVVLKDPSRLKKIANINWEEGERIRKQIDNFADQRNE